MELLFILYFQQDAFYGNKIFNIFHCHFGSLIEYRYILCLCVYVCLFYCYLKFDCFILVE